MLGEIVFMSNYAAIWYTAVMVPLFIIFLLVFMYKMQKAKKENEALKKEIADSYGKSTSGEDLIEPGRKYEFKTGFGFETRWVFIMIIKDLKGVRFCHLADPHKWVFDGRHGFAPEDGVVYIAAESDDDKIILDKEKRSRH